MAGNIITIIKDEKYRLQYMKNGRRESKTIKVKSYTAAQKELAKFVTDIERGQYVNTSYTLFEFSKVWIKDYLIPQNCTEDTIRRYINILNNWIYPKIGANKLNTITRLLLTSFFNNLKNEKTKYSNRNNENISKRTYEKIYSVLHAMLEKAVDWEILFSNPCPKIGKLNNLPSEKIKHIKKIKGQEDVHVFTIDEYPKVVNSLYNENDLNRKTVCLTALEGGLRKSEIFGLTPEDINFDSGTIFINKSRHQIRGIKERKTGPTKNSSSIRKIKVSHNLMLLYKEIINKYKIRNNEYFFDSISMDGIYTWFIRFQNKINISNIITFHDLRHTHATISYTLSRDLKGVSERLGHSDVVMTSKIYMPFITAIDEEISNKLDEIKYSRDEEIALKLHSFMK